MARAARRASSSDAAPVTRTVTSLVAPSPPRTMPMASGSQAAVRLATSSGQSLSVSSTPLAPLASDEHAVVGRALAVDGDRVERVVDRGLQRALQQRRRHRGVGRHEAEHRRHQRLDHAGALGHAADAERAVRAADASTDDFLRERIGRHDRARGGGAAVAATAAPAASAMPRSTLAIVELDADDARRGDEHRRRLALDRLGRARGHRARVLAAVGAGARVRAAAVDDDGAAAACRIARGARATGATGAAFARLVVKTAGGARHGVGDERATRSRPPDALMPHATPAARKPRGAVMPPSTAVNVTSGWSAAPSRRYRLGRSSSADFDERPQRQPPGGRRARAVDDRRRKLGPDRDAGAQGSITACCPQRRKSAQPVQSCAIFSGTQMCGTIVKPMRTKCDGSCVNAHSVEKPLAVARRRRPR